MKKIFQRSNVKKIGISLEGNAIVNVSKSFDGRLTIVVKYVSNNLDFNEEDGLRSYELKIIDLGGKKIKDLLSDISKFTSFVDIAQYLSQNSNNSDAIMVDINLPSEVEVFDLKLNNGTIKADYLDLEVFTLRGNNLFVQLKNQITMKECDVRVNNSSLEIDLNESLKAMSVRLNNGNITFNRIVDSNVGIKVKGNNVETYGDLSTGKDIVVCRLNKGVVRVD